MLKLNGRRSSVDIVADILRLLRLGEAGKTEIMYTVNMSYYQLQVYLNRLLELKVIDRTTTAHQSVTYGTTKKGLRLLSVIESIQEMLKPGEALDLLHEYEARKLLHRSDTSVSPMRK